MSAKRRMSTEPPPPPPPILPPELVTLHAGNDTILIANYLEQQPPPRASMTSTNNKVIIADSQVSVDSRALVNDRQAEQLQIDDGRDTNRVDVARTTSAVAMGNAPMEAYAVDTEDSRKSSLQSDEEALMMHPIEDSASNSSHLDHYCTLRAVHKPTKVPEVPAFCTLHRRMHRTKSIRKRRSTIQSIPDSKVNDYLQELDAYLDEIDQEDVTYDSSSSCESCDYDDGAHGLGIHQMFACATTSSADQQPHESIEIDSPTCQRAKREADAADDAVIHQPAAAAAAAANNEEDDRPLFLKQLNNYCTLRIPLRQQQVASTTTTTAPSSTYFPTTNDIHDYFVGINAKNRFADANKSETENQSNLCNKNIFIQFNSNNQLMAGKSNNNTNNKGNNIINNNTTENDSKIGYINLSANNANSDETVVGSRKSDCFKRDKQTRHTIIGGQTKKRESEVGNCLRHNSSNNGDGLGKSGHRNDNDGGDDIVAISERQLDAVEREGIAKEEETVEPVPKRGRQLSWLRNSMRKTRPIDLPATSLSSETSLIDSHQPSTSRHHDNNNRHIKNLVQQSTHSMDSHKEEAPIRQQSHGRSMPRPRQRAPDVPVPTPPFSDFSTFNQISYSPQPPVIDSNSLPHSQRSRHQLPRSRSHSANQRQSGVSGTPESQEEVPIRLNVGADLNEENIFNTILNTTTTATTTPNAVPSNTSTPDRPRQMGRRSEMRPRVVSINASGNNTPTHQPIGNHRPNSAPARVSTGRPNSSSPGHRNQSFLSSEPSSAGSSRNPSPVSIVSSTASSSMASGVENTAQRSRSRQRPRITDLDENTDETESASKTTWPHIVSRILATVGCTLGLFNISRFAIYSIHFGANFIVQFLMLSFLFGCPFLWLQMCLAAKIKGGPVQMWRISPICKGVGIALLIAQGVLTIYSSISVGWVLVYFRDSFATTTNKYRWQEHFELYRGPYVNNQSSRLSDSVADYFNGVVLQRLQLGPAGRAGGANMGAVRFQLAFNLGIIWTFVFIVLCRGIRSYGKFVIVLGTLPFVGLIVVCSKFLSMINFDSVQNIFPATDWQDFFLNYRSWVSAAQETFLTWALLGISVYSMYCKSYNTRPTKTELRRDALIVVLLTILGLLLGAILGSSCVQILNQRNYFYFPGSYENIKTYTFLLPADKPLPHYLQSIPAKWIERYSMVLGENQKLFGANTAKESGYQALRLVTELFPAALAAASRDFVAPIWSLLGYLTFLFLGLAQLCAMWKPLAGCLGNSPSSVLLSCITGLFLGIPLATESGIAIIHYLDTVLGGAWWVLVLWFAHLFGIFLIRGTPYTSDVLVNDLQMQSFSAFIAFSWNVLLPIGLLMLSVVQYRVSNSREFFQWRPNGGYYWPQWTRQIAGGLQIGFLLIVPFIGLVQMYRYLTKGPPDILDRIQLLYRPALNSEPAQRHPPLRRLQHPLPERTNPTIISLEQQLDDAPPKYTPPPSYTTATGARIAKMLRQSIRRSVRRIMGEGSRQQSGATSIPPINIPPPNYSSIILNDPATRSHAPISVINPRSDGDMAMGPRLLFNSETLGRRRSLNTDISNASTLTPRDISQFLRSSQQGAPPQPESTTSNSLSLMRDTLRSSLTRSRPSRSVENLVMAAAPLGDSSIINLADHRNYDDENVSVI